MNGETQVPALKMKPPVTNPADEQLVILQLRMPAGDYEAIRQAAQRSYRSTHKEALFRLRQSFAVETTAPKPASRTAAPGRRAS
jgi:hypothetical protein